MYDDLASLYDVFVDWPKRLAGELPHLNRLGVGKPGLSILDVACGTGRHALAWADQGCRVTACDESVEMVERAKSSDTEGTVDWRAAGMLSLPSDVCSDVIVCLGTSLPHVSTREDYGEALAEFPRHTHPGGRVVVHSRPLGRVLATGDRFMEPLARTTPEGTVLFWRFYDLIPPDHLDFHMVIMREQDGSWTHKVLTSRLCAISDGELLRFAADAGFPRARCCGHLDDRDYVADESPDIVLIADM